MEIIDPKAKQKPGNKPLSKANWSNEPKSQVYDQPKEISNELKINQYRLRQMEDKYDKMEALLARLDGEKAFLKTNDKKKKISKDGKGSSKKFQERKR